MDSAAPNPGGPAAASVRRPWVVALFAGYLLTLLLWLADVVGRLFLPLEVGSWLGFVGVVGSPLFFLGIAAWALWPPRARTKLVALGVAGLLGFLSFEHFTPLRAASDRLYLMLHAGEFEAFVAEIRGDGRIWSMTHGEDWFKRLNGVMVAHTEAGRDSVTIGQDRRPLLATVLERDGIEPGTYRAFADRLQDLHFEEFAVHGAVTTFRRDRDTGVAHVPSSAGALRPGDLVPGTSVAVVRHVLGDWYAWYCCPR